MCDFFDDDFFDIDLEDFAYYGALWGIVEEEMDDEERLRKEIEKDPDDDFPF